MSAGADAVMGAGAKLKAARLQRQLSLAQLALQLKVPEGRLAALEAERWSDLPGGPYARGLATAVCRALNVEAAAVLMLMPGAAPVALERVHEGLNRPFQERPTGLQGGSRPLLGAALLMLSVALGIWSWQRGWLESLGPSPANSPQEAVAAAEEVRHVEAPLVPPDTPPAVARAPASVVPLSAASTAASAPIQPAASASEPLQVATRASDSASTGPSLTPKASLDIVARDTTWVSVSDGTGTSLISRMMTRGERLQLDSPAGPLRVVLGNAAGAEVQWRGQIQDLSAFYGVRVARLTLN